MLGNVRGNEVKATASLGETNDLSFNLRKSADISSISNPKPSTKSEEGKPKSVSDKGINEECLGNL